MLRYTSCNFLEIQLYQEFGVSAVAGLVLKYFLTIQLCKPSLEPVRIRRVRVCKYEYTHIVFGDLHVRISDGPISTGPGQSCVVPDLRRSVWPFRNSS
jgi:hypothetical protein